MSIVTKGLVSSGSGNGVPGEIAMVGDLKQSFLTEAQFDSELPKREKGKWVLADGRDITGTKFATITGATHVMDMRGAYIRMAGVNAALAGWDGGTLGRSSNYQTGLPTTPFAGTAADAGGHKHTLSMSAIHGLGQDTHLTQWGKVMAGYNKDESPVTGSQSYWSSTNDAPVDEAPDHSHTVVITSGGDKETRPCTIALNYFVKVN